MRSQNIVLFSSGVSEREGISLAIRDALEGGLFVQLLAGAVPRCKGQPEHLTFAHAGEENSNL